MDIDLNEVVSKAVNDKIRELEGEVSALNKKANEDRVAIAGLKAKVSEADDILSLSAAIKARYSALKHIYGDYETSVAEQQYEIICGFMKLAFGEKPYTDRFHGNYRGILWPNLAVGFHHCIENLVVAIKAIVPDSSKLVSNISHYTIPWNWNRATLSKFLKECPYNTNGGMTGISEYWMEGGAGYKNVPYDIVLKSPLFREDGLFNELCDAIRSKRQCSDYLFILPDVNELSDEQIGEMGRLVPGNTIHKDSNMALFIKRYLRKFDEDTIGKICQKAVDGYGWELLNYQWFPVKWQKQFLMGKEFKEILSIFAQSGCEWTVEQKREFLSEYFNPTASIEKGGE